ncbi:hypothetical protein ACJIZ3_009028 [Penstemon smallii]|uniref:Uncharacterized protein n=1 Tax=Penstemon smallii TaxID=265156 RepID=A0ABD3TD99_9LAMI
MRSKYYYSTPKVSSEFFPNLIRTFLKLIECMCVRSPEETVAALLFCATEMVANFTRLFNLVVSSSSFSLYLRWIV